MKSLTEKEYETLNLEEKKKYNKEWSCECNECKHKWFYLDKVEKEMNKQMGLNGLLQAGNCCNPCVGATISNANVQLSKQVKELKQCPKCKSSNVTRSPKFFKEQ